MKNLFVLVILVVSTIASARDTVLASCGRGDRNRLHIMQSNFGGGGMYGDLLFRGTWRKLDCYRLRGLNEAFECTTEAPRGRVVYTVVRYSGTWVAEGTLSSGRSSESIGSIGPCTLY